MSAVPAGRGEPHGVLPAALCFLASEHSAGVAGKDLLPSVYPRNGSGVLFVACTLALGTELLETVFC